MTSFHMVEGCSATGARERRRGRDRREREKDIEPLRSKATTTGALNGVLVHGCGAGKFQHAWNALCASRSVVSLLAVFLFAFVMVACASSAPGTIGALLGQRTDGRLFVRGAPPGQGAERAGLEVEDEILAIDGRPVKEMSQEDVRRAVRGDVGSTLTLTIERAGQRRDVKVERSPILADKPDRSPK
jgi:carboxyl-terminal processing protease